MIQKSKILQETLNLFPYQNNNRMIISMNISASHLELHPHQPFQTMFAGVQQSQQTFLEVGPKSWFYLYSFLLLFSFPL